MNNKIKKENRKALLPFLGMILISGTVGGFLGGFSQYFQEELNVFFAQGLYTLIKVINPYAIPVTALLLLIPAWILYLGCRKKYQLALNEDNEFLLDKIEKQISYLLLLTSVCMIFIFFFFASNIVLLFKSDDLNFTSMWFLPEFIVAVTFIILTQQKAIDLLKMINPEKKGSVYDPHFSKKWQESCDEAEMMQIYQASYASYRFTTTFCIVLWGILILFGIIMDTGLLPVALVTLIWLVQTVTYCLEAIRLSK